MEPLIEPILALNSPPAPRSKTERASRPSAPGYRTSIAALDDAKFDRDAPPPRLYRCTIRQRRK